MEGFYDSLHIHRVMLRDEIRNQAYRQALAAVVKPGAVVLDFGAGTGILSLFAAQAGAAHVFAVERTTMARLARQLVARNGFANRVTVIQADIEAVRLPCQVDVIVSEWLGTYGVDENMLAPLLLARDRWLKPGGKLLPESATAWLAPLQSRELATEMAQWRGRPYGLDLSLIAAGAAQEVAWVGQPLSADDLLAAPQKLWTTNVYTMPAAQARRPFRAALNFNAARTGQVNGLTAWFTAEFGAGISLTNAPTAPKTHWSQYLFPLNQATPVEPGTPLRVDFTCLPLMPGYCAHAWSAQIGAGAWEHHDTRWVVWDA